MRAACHPSESPEHLWTRVLAYALEFADGIQFSPGGVSGPDEPPLFVRDLTGRYRAWIEVGWPDADRLHKAAKAAPRVAVYVHKDPAPWLARLDGARIHRASEIEILAIDRGLIAALVDRLDRRVACAVSVSDREVTVAIGDQVIGGVLTPMRLG